MAGKILTGDVFAVLPSVEAGSMDTCVTSPPYWMLRSYLQNDDPLKPLEIGQEATREEYIHNIVKAFRLVRNCLTDWGTCWINCGDTYTHARGKRKPGDKHGPKQCTNTGSVAMPSATIDGMEEGNMALVPQALAIALQADGWIVRSYAIWHKPAPMPASVSGWAWKRCKVKLTRNEHAAMQQMQTNEERQRFLQDQKRNHAGLQMQGVQTVGGKGMAGDGERKSDSEEDYEKVGIINQRQGVGEETAQAAEAKGPLQRICGKVRQKRKRKTDNEGVAAHPEGEGGSKENERKTTHVACDLSEQLNGNGMGDDSGVIQSQMRLLREGETSHARPCYSSYQGRQPHEGKCGSILPPVQCEKGEQDAELWSDCPGCGKCLPNGGYVLKRGSWRPTNAFEPILFLAKTDNYFADGEPTKTPTAASTISRDKYTRVIDDPNEQFSVKHDHETTCDNGANLRDVWKTELEGMSKEELIELVQSMQTGDMTDVWRISSEPLGDVMVSATEKVSHYAAFPTNLVRRCLMASVSERGYCPKCNAPWARMILSKQNPHPNPGRPGYRAEVDVKGGNQANGSASMAPDVQTVGWRPTCSCGDLEPRPGRVLDPFSGSGRTGVACQWLGLDYLGVELNPKSVRMSETVLYENSPLFS